MVDVISSSRVTHNFTKLKNNITNLLGVKHMANLKLLTAAAVAGALSLSVAATDAQAIPAGMEKCYGIAKASMNDCAGNNHSCAGQAKTSSDANEWVAVPEGTCKKIAGGMTKDADTKKH